MARASKVKENAEDGSLIIIDGEQISNGGDYAVRIQQPYVITLGVRGVATLLSHRYNPEDVEAKKNAPKNSEIKNKDNIEAYVYRDDEGRICIPGTYIYACLQDAGRYEQDPRSPRKSMRDLIKAGIVPLTELAPFMRDGEYLTTWDYVDKQRVKVTQSAVPRERPAFTAGWQLEWELMVTAPEWITPQKVHQLATNAGRLCGLADYRPTYGRFAVSRFEVTPYTD